MAYARRDLAGAAVATTLNGGISSGAPSLVITSATGWPSGSNGDFFIVIDRGNAGEEKVRIASRTSTTLTVQTSGRGSDGTSAAAHASGVTVEHCLTAVDLDEANYAVAKTVGLIAAQGDILVGSAANTLAKLAKGSSGLPLVAGASTLSYTTLAAAALAADSVTATQIAAGAVGTSELASGILPGSISFTKTGVLVTGTGVIRWPAPVALTIQNVRLVCNTAPTGAAILVDVNKNGTTIFTTQGNRPTIAISANAQTATTAPDVTAMAAGDYLTVDIDQVGSSVAGSNLTITVYYLV